MVFVALWVRLLPEQAQYHVVDKGISNALQLRSLLGRIPLLRMFSLQVDLTLLQRASLDPSAKPIGSLPISPRVILEAIQAEVGLGLGPRLADSLLWLTPLIIFLQVPQPPSFLECPCYLQPLPSARIIFMSSACNE